MLWVGLPLLIVGVLYGIGLIVSVVRSFHDPHYLFQSVLVALAMLFYLALGTWTSKSAKAFAEIVLTRGRDIDHLIDALDNLRKMYALLSLLVKVYVALVLVSVVIGLTAALVSAVRP
jgi:hypothetical protein